ncbi:pumilio homolog 12-like [Salvia miltiorrhiza]|uniref:pumilio homolog 12-like n=1 Tax=Salvia miltiorrhiza TaxID=226208 RepID=UPI0025ABA80F|nr:pumilio homolog 12-like [Salvia miltiorrhiza]
MDRRDGVELFRNFAAFQEFSMTGNHHHPDATGNHHHAAFFAAAAANHYLQSDQPNSNSQFWAAGNQLPAAAAGFVNHQQHNNDFLTAGNHLNMNGTGVHISPRYADDQALLESEFARLSVMPTVRPSALITAPQPNYNGGRNYSMLNDNNNGRNIIDMRQMRIQSAARGLYMNSDFDDNLYNSWRDNTNLNGYNHNNSQFRNSYELGMGRGRSLTSLKDLRGKIFSVATDQNGCRFLQSKFEEGKPEEIQMIFMEVKDHICELMVDQFGNYLVQKFLAACNQEQMTHLLMAVINDEHRFMDICVDTHGSRSVQRLLEFLTTAEQRSRLISVLRRITLPLTKSMNGHHVIQYFLKFYSVEDKKHILNVVADHCMEIATDKSGCCVLQQCVEHAVGEPRDRLISEITSNALMLSEHPYGNYVVQYILGLRMAHATGNIIAQLSGNIVSLSMSKYGSNVVEKFLKDPDITQDTQIIPIIEELIYSPHFLRVLQDPFGNYVAQSAFAASKGGLRSAMISLIQANNPNLHSHPHGKRVLQCIKGNKIRV